LIAKIYTDEDISPLLAQHLRQNGVDAVAAHEVGMTEKDDIDHLRYATQEQRVL
jgi:predicted nuclease of predicted toxin-antitoxin system